MPVPAQFSFLYTIANQSDVNSAGAFVADASDQVFHALGGETRGTSHRRDDSPVKTECLMAFLAIEMTVHLVGSAIMVVMAEAILLLAASVLYLMHHMMLGKKRECTEYGTAVHRVECHFHIIDTECIGNVGNGSAYE